MKKFSSTTRASSHRNFFAERRGRLLLLLAAFVLAAFLLPTLANVVAGVVMRPFVAVATWVRESPGALPVYLRERSRLVDEMEALQAKLDTFTATDMTISRLTEENISLRTFHGEGESKRLLTRVVARPPFLPYDRIQIDKGAVDGVVVGAPVYAGHDIVIGSVVAVGERDAFVTLVSSPGFLSTVYVPEATLAATMEGVGGGVSRIRFPQGVRITPGAIVVLLAYDSGIYGTVSHVQSEPTQPEQYAYVSIPESVQSLRYLTVGARPIAVRAPEEVASSTLALVADYFSLPAVVPLLSATTSATTTDTGTTTPTL
jgi:cell shape-determining protein MreC